MGLGEMDEHTHPSLIPGQSGVHSCRCSHSRAWIWLGKGSINQLILQEAVYSGAAVRNALSRVCAGVPQPCMRACNTRVPVPRLSVHRAGLLCINTKQPLQRPGKGASVMGKENISPVLRANTSDTARRPLAPLRAHTSVVGANKRGAHVQARLRTCSPSFPLKSAEQDPSPHSGGKEL